MHGEDRASRENSAEAEAHDPTAELLEQVDIGPGQPDDGIESITDPTLYTSEKAGPSAREAYARMLEDYAAAIRSGRLNGVRAQWREGLHHATCVELEARPVQLPDGKLVRRVALRRYEFMTPERPENPPEPHDDDTAGMPRAPRD